MEAEYELPDPDDDDDDPDYNGAAPTEIQGVDVENPNQEPPVIGDRAPPIGIHNITEEVAVQPMEPVVTTPTPDPIGVVTKAPDELEPTDAPLPLVPVLVPPRTEHELHWLEINDEVPNLT